MDFTGKSDNISKWNVPLTQLYQDAIRMGANITNTGAISVKTGKYTGRLPRAKRIVKDLSTQLINWDGLNIPITPELFKFYQTDCQRHISNNTKIYTVDAYAGWSTQYRVGVRVYTYQPEHALFSKNMLIPCEEPLDNPDLTIYDLGDMELSDLTKPPIDIIDPTLTDALVGLDLSNGIIIIIGTKYAGEIKKSVFSFMMYRMPTFNFLPLHSSANVDLNGKNATLFFGLSGTGKTTLSADTGRILIGDDEHVWHPDGIFNIEGGCYAKCINLDPVKEPDIYKAIRFGTVVENVHHNLSGEADYNNVSITENSRASYPLQHLNSVIPASTNQHPNSIIFLTCDVTGVIPPLSLLTPKQIMTCFLLGYTSKVPGTEVSVREPEIAFSACFGEPFLVWKPERYGELLLQYLELYPAPVWLLNTGWMGGTATQPKLDNGLPRRIPIKESRTMVRYIQTTSYDTIKTESYSQFGWQIPKQVPGLADPNILKPVDIWEDTKLCDRETEFLYQKFRETFRTKYGKNIFDKYWFGNDT